MAGQKGSTTACARFSGGLTACSTFATFAYACSTALVNPRRHDQLLWRSAEKLTLVHAFRQAKPSCVPFSCLFLPFLPALRASFFCSRYIFVFVASATCIPFVAITSSISC